MARPKKSADDPFRWFDSSPEVIRLVVMMYVRYPPLPEKRCKRSARGEVRVRSVPAGVSGYGAGVVPGRHPAEFRVRALFVVVAPPVLQHGAGMRQRAEQVSFSSSSRSRPLKLSVGIPRWPPTRPSGPPRSGFQRLGRPFPIH